MEVSSSSETFFTSNGLHWVIFQETKLTVTATVRSSNPAERLKRSQVVESPDSDVSVSKERTVKKVFRENIYFPQIQWLDIHKSAWIWVYPCTLFATDSVAQIQFSHNLCRMQKVALLNGWLVTTFQRKKNSARFLATHFRTWLVSTIICLSEINMETSSAWRILKLRIIQREKNNCSKKVSSSITGSFAVRGRITFSFKAWDLMDSLYWHYWYISKRLFNKTD
jgi:hypothetical protein